MATRHMGFAAVALALLLLALAVATGALAQPAKPEVTGAWLRLPAVSGRPAAAYFTVTSATADRLLAVTTPAAARTELHESKMAGGAMTMAPVAQVAVAAGRPAVLKPGGLHLMLYGLKPDIRPGARIPLTLRFANAGTVSVEAEARAADAPAGDHAHH